MQFSMNSIRKTCVMGEMQPCDVSRDEEAGRMARLSCGIWRQSACLFAHFLPGCTNRSTSCLLSMMLSSRQEITCYSFFSPHQSFPSLSLSLCDLSPLSCLLICPSSSWCALFSCSFCKLLIVMTRPSAVSGFYLPPDVHFYPTSSDPVTAHLNPMKM